MQRDSNGAVIVERVTGATPQQIRRDYCERATPVIMTDAASDWAAMQLLTPDYLRKHFAWKAIRFEDGWLTLGDVFDRIDNSDPENPAPYPLLMLLDPEFPELQPMADPVPLPHSFPNRLTDPGFRGEQFGSRTELFIGGPGGNFPYIHIDYYHLHAWITQVYGSKEFTIFPPEDAPYLYIADNGWQSEIENPWDPDLERYPLYAKTHPSKVTLHAGETLFIPNGLWHTARSLEVTLSIAFDQLNRMNMSGYLRDIIRSHRSHPRMPFWVAAMVLRASVHSCKERVKAMLGR